MDERDVITVPTAEQPEAPATEETSEQTAERVPWQQQLVSVQPEASEVEAVGEEDDAGEGEGGEPVETHDLDQAAEQILASPEIDAFLNSRGNYADPAKYSLTEKFAAIATPEDKPLVEGFFEIIAEARAGQAFADKLLDVAENSIAQRQALYDADVEHKGEMEIMLRNEWGNEAPARLEELKTFLDEAPGRLGEAFIDARTSDGKRLIDHPSFPAVMSDLVRGTVSPVSNAAARLEKIQGILKRDPARYFREKLDEEALKLRRQVQSEQSADEVAGKRPVSRREAEILSVMKSDINKFWREGMSDELANIRAAKAARGQ